VQVSSEKVVQSSATSSVKNGGFLVKAPKDCFTIEVAFMTMDVSRRTLFNMIKRNEIKVRKIGYWTFVPKKEVEKFLNG
jgi:hypothetical protein